MGWRSIRAGVGGDSLVQALQGPSLEERVGMLRELMEAAPEPMVSEYQERFDLAWIYHDSALEGVVYSMDELQAAMRDEVVSDPIAYGALTGIITHS